MRRTVLIVPDLLGETSILSQKLPALERIAEMGRLSKIGTVPDVETPEALCLGLAPDQGQLRQGPLTVAALGVDPPTRSTHFHLSLMSFADGVGRSVAAGIALRDHAAGTRRASPAATIDADEQRAVFELAKKLNTKTLTIVEGEGLDHGLVWESIGDHRTSAPPEVEGKPILEHLPEGDAEVPLRRFIDDSINILSEIELNERRIDDDLPPLNLLWPWGEGIRLPLPNLALKRGEPALVLSSSMRLAGLTRLVGYRHGDRREFGRGTNTRLAKIAETCLGEPVAIVLIDAFSMFRQNNQLDEAEWLAHELDRLLLKPLFEEALKTPWRLKLLSPPSPPSSLEGLAVELETPGSLPTNVYPFDERSLDERSVPVGTLWELVARGL